MYLVFITMLALNVSKEVLDGFGQMFKKIQSANVRLDQSNDVYYTKISTNAAEKEGKWVGHDRTAKQIKLESEEFYDKIQEIKDKITEAQRVEDPELESIFLKEASSEGLEYLKGHRTVGGMRASIYNPMKIDSVLKLKEFMVNFEKKYG